MKRSWWVLAVCAAVVIPAAGRAQQPDSAGVEDPEVRTLRQQFRQRWNEHIRQTLGLTDEQTAKLQVSEERFEQQRVQHRVRLRDINRQLNGEMLAEKPDNEKINRLLRDRQETRLHLEQVDRDQDGDMAGYLSPRQRVRYQQERTRVQGIIAEQLRHRRERGGGGLAPVGPRGSGARPRAQPRRRP